MIINISYPRKSLCNLRLPSIMHGPVCPRKHRKLQNCRLKPSQVSTVNRFYWEEVCVIDEPVWIKMPGEKTHLFTGLREKPSEYSVRCVCRATHMVPFTPVLANSHGKREFGFSVSVLQAEWVRFGCDGTLLFCCHIKEPHTEGDI